MKKSIRDEIARMTAEELRNVRTNVHKYIEQGLMSLLGLSRDYSGRTEIDHCNGRNSILIDAFREIAKEEVTNIAKNYKPTKDELDIYKSAFKKEIASQMSYIIREEARERAKQIAREAMSKVNINVDAILESNFGVKPERKAGS